MSETEPIPPTSSVTALRIPIIKKGEYDLWSMKMRQYIAITDHILWDIITNGKPNTTTYPASLSSRSLWNIKARFGETKDRSIKGNAKESLNTTIRDITIDLGKNKIAAYESSPNIAFLKSHQKSRALPLKQILRTYKYPKETQAASTRCPLLPTMLSHSDESICSSFLKQASMPTTHDEDLLQIDEDAMEEIDIRWQVAMITAKIRKFMRRQKIQGPQA
ncbi:hypothetical protein Tco_0363979 [Tanacetum coccineum]